MSSTRWFWFAVAVIAAGAVGAWAGNRFGGSPAPAPTSGSAKAPDPAPAPAADEGPVARVRVSTVTRGTIREELVAYGTVVAALGETDAISVPYECRVRKVLVADGQHVGKDGPLVEIEPSPDTTLALDRAKSDRASATAALDLVRQRMEMKLATRADVLGAEQALKSAELGLESLEKRGIDGVRTLTAPDAAVVNGIDAEPGAIVAAGAPLLTIVGEDRISVRLGIEAEDVGSLHEGEELRLTPVNGSADRTVKGTIRFITHRVDPDTRLVDVFVAPEAGAGLLLNAYVRGTLTVRTADALLVPRSAVRPEDGKEVLFTVEGDRAVRREVELGIVSPARVQVISDAVKEGDRIVVDGNAELADGMAVKTEPAR